MRANEIITEDKKLWQYNSARIGDPFRYDWKFYYLPKGLFHDWGAIIGYAIIKDKPVIWEVTGYHGKRWGGSYTGTEQEINKIMKGRKPAKITLDDAKMAWYASIWDRARTEKREQMIPDIILLSKSVSPQFKKAPKGLWRGLKLTPKRMNELKAGKRIKINKSLGSSWTYRKETAQGFTVGGGVIIKKNFLPVDVIVNLQSLLTFFHVATNRFMEENEILIHGNGIGPYLDPKKEELEGYKFTARDWGEGNVWSFKIFDTN